MSMLQRSLLCAAVLASLTAPAVAGGAQLGTVASLADTTDQFVVTWKAGAAGLDAAATASVLAESGLSVRFQRGDKLRLDRRVPHAEADRLAEALRRADPRIAEIHADRWATIQTVPNDPRWADQWHYHEQTAGIRLPKALDKSTGAGVVVAVLDTGYRPHADLAANLVPGYDMIIDTAVANDGDGRDADAQDPGDGCGGQSSWHGTHVAGTIAAVSDNGLGVAGVAPGAKVQPVRVLGCGGGYFSDIVDGITWASGGTVAGVPANPTPARVINMSLSGGGACPASLQSAINGAVARGTVVVVAAGNSNVNVSNAVPANCPNVIAVAAITSAGSRASFSNYGTGIDISAPGQSILSTLNTGTTTPGSASYASYNGTSMAAPHVAGVVALMQAAAASPLTPAAVESTLKSTARPLPGSCSGGCGAGIANADGAVTAVQGGGPDPDPGTQTYTNGTDVSIPDNNSTGVSSTIAVSGRSGNAPSNAQVAVKIVHTYIGDLIVDLIAPDGSVYVLHNRSGGSADNINQTYTVNLSSEALNGSWRLRARDRASIDTGYINSWSITF